MQDRYSTRHLVPVEFDSFERNVRVADRCLNLRIIWESAETFGRVAEHEHFKLFLLSCVTYDVLAHGDHHGVHHDVWEGEELLLQQ